MSTFPRKIFIVAGVFFALWLGTKFVLPVILPFLAGGVVAFLAEPLVRLGVRQGKMSRSLAAGLGVATVLLLLTGALFLLGALALRELGQLAGMVPDLQDTASRGMMLLQDWLVSAADHTPEGVRPLVTQTVLNVFDDGTVLMNEVTAKIPQFLTAILGGVPDGLLGLGTGVLASFMISARLPMLKQYLQQRLPQAWKEQYLPALTRVQKALFGWLKAQGKLMLVTYAIVTAGLMILGVPYGPMWAVLIALIDAIPMLGTGIILVPWAVVELLQGQQLRVIVLLGIFACATVARSTLEPRFVGKQLGIDPLLTLLALYVGYRIWGFLGLLAAPLLAAGIKALTDLKAT